MPQSSAIQRIVSSRCGRIGSFAFLLALAACGGGGSSNPAPPPPAATLISIALSPLDVTLAPGNSSTLTVVGTYSDGSTRSLAAASETFTSSDNTTISVDANGLATAAVSAVNGAQATISARDTASGLTTPQSGSTIVTIAAGGNGPPTPTSAAAATQTAQSNASCTAIQPFYWEIGNGEDSLASGSSTQVGGTAIAATTRFPIASASKWIYGMYVIQQRGGAANLSATDIKFLNFTSGYTYMDTTTQGVTCTPPSSGPNSIDHCLTLPSSTPGKTFASYDPMTDSLFAYNSGHEENHAGQNQPEINDLDTLQLGPAIVAGLGVSTQLRYNQPLLAGGVFASAADYAPILRAVVSGQLGMRDALGANAVCAWVGPGCNAVRSPAISVQWHYSMAHWVEDDPTSGDGAFSSPGAFGFYPWIGANKRYYGVISRLSNASGELQDGLASSRCGHELRAAWETGVAP
jgi:hypothetical protein